MLTRSGKHQLLAALGGPLFASAHSGFPGQGGLHELAGGAYTRKSIAWAAPADDMRVLSTFPVLDIPARSAVAYIGLWTTQTAGTGLFLGCISPGGLERWGGVLADQITWRTPGHAFANGHRVAVLTATSEIVGYIVGVNGDLYQIATVPGGTPISFPPGSLGDPDAVRVVRNNVHTYESAGTFRVASWSIEMGGGAINTPPSWNQSLAQITLTVGQTYDLRGAAGAVDADNDTLVFSVDPAGTPLTGATLSPSGILTATGVVDLTGVRFIADDGR